LGTAKEQHCVRRRDKGFTPKAYFLLQLKNSGAQKTRQAREREVIDLNRACVLLSSRGSG